MPNRPPDPAPAPLPASALIRAVAARALGMIVELAAVTLLGAWAVSWLAPRAALRPDQVSLLPLESIPSDANGTIWYWYWYREAWARGVPVTAPDVLCAPGSLELRQSFPGSIDAAFALPFFSTLPMPAALNWTLLAIPVASLVCAYAMFRGLWSGDPARQWIDRAAAIPVALAAASWFGAQAYIFAEIRAGRPVTAMAFLLPIYLLALRSALVNPGWTGIGWAIAAGWAASLVARAYAPFALPLLAISVAAGAWYTARPAPGVRRWRPILAGGIVAIAGLWLCLPWLHELWVIRGLGPSGLLSGPRSAPAALWEPRLYADLWSYIHLPSQQAPDRPSSFYMLARGVQEQAMPADWLWRIAPGEPGRRAWISRAALVAGALGAALGGVRGGRWALLAGGLLLFIAGPQVATDVTAGRVRYWEPGGGPIRLPLAWLLEAAPGLSPYLKPYRAAPLLVLALGGAWAVGAERAWRWMSAKIADRGAAQRWAGLAAVWAISVGLILWNIHELNRYKYLKLHEHPWSVPPFISKLHGSPEEILVELPAGIGHATAWLQPIHGMRRSEGHPDQIQRLRQTAAHPDQCYRTAFLRSIWYLDRGLGLPGGAMEAAVASGLSAESIAEARAQGVRYVLLYPGLYDLYRREGVAVEQGLAVARLRAALGEPVYSGAEAILWELRDKSVNR